MSTHDIFVEHEEVTGPSNRKFGFTVGGVLLALGSVGFIIHYGEIRPVQLLFLVAGAVLVALALLAPGLLTRANRAWMSLGHLLSMVVTPVVMLLVFAFTVVPVALVMRLRGRDLLRLRRIPAGRSYWIDRVPPGPAPETMGEQF